MKRLFVAMLMLAAIATDCYADAFKCRTSSGKVVISDSGCTGTDRLERVQSREAISLERQRQAREVGSRNAFQLEGIEMQKAADRESYSGPRFQDSGLSCALS